MNKYHLFILALCACATLTSCADDAFYTSTYYTKDDYWGRGDVATFDFDITDTTARYDISAILRSSDGYPWANIYMFSSLLDSTTVIHTDTLHCVLCDPHGNPTGQGLSNVKENEMLLHSNFAFPHIGTYSIQVSHGMRNIELQGVSSISLRITKQHEAQ